MADERKILETVIDWIVECGSTQYGSIYAVCDEEDTARYADDLCMRYEKAYPDRNIIRVSGEEYTRELILAVKNNDDKAFRCRYFDADLLILTGAEQIRAKQMTQQNLYVAVDKLFEKQRQVVFFSSMLPKNIPNLEDRNRAQFEGSLIINLL